MLKIKGDKELIRTIRKYAKAYPKAVLESIEEQGHKIMLESKKQVPVKTGRLKRSGRVFVENVLNKVTLAYGTSYGLNVHERYEVFHKNGKPRFLQDPILEAAGTWQMDMILLIRRNIRRQGLQP